MGLTQHSPFKEVYPSCQRSVYLMTQRFQRHPYLSLFDGADTNTTTGRRSTSTVPLQALYLMNDPFVREQAGGFARRLIREGADCRQRVDLAYRWTFARPAQPDEQDRAVRYVGEFARRLAQMGLTNEQQELEAWTSYTRVLFCANEFVYLD
jgi:hypothetical protein